MRVATALPTASNQKILPVNLALTSPGNNSFCRAVKAGIPKLASKFTKATIRTITQGSIIQ